MMLQRLHSKQFAFTLAEALLTLVIVGVVAALTIPGLKKYTERQTLATQLKNGYSTLNKSLDYVLASDDTIDIAKIGGDAFFTNHMIPNLNVAKSCTDANMSECIPDDTDNLPFKPKNAVVLVGGFTIANNGMDFIIDANGPSEPNVFESDIYQYKLSPDSMTTNLSSNLDFGQLVAAFFDAITPKAYAFRGSSSFGGGSSSFGGSTSSRGGSSSFGGSTSSRGGSSSSSFGGSSSSSGSTSSRNMGSSSSSDIELGPHNSSINQWQDSIDTSSSGRPGSSTSSKTSSWVQDNDRPGWGIPENEKPGHTLPEGPACGSSFGAPPCPTGGSSSSNTSSNSSSNSSGNTSSNSSGNNPDGSSGGSTGGSSGGAYVGSHGWNFIPVGKAREIMDNGWKITHF